MRHLQLILVFLISLIGQNHAFAEKSAADWEIITEDDGIIVSQKEVPGRSLPIFKGQATFDSGVFDILGVLQDVGTGPQWMHACKEAQLLEKISDFEFIIYNRTDAPWPISDRDVVVHSKATYNKEEGWLKINMLSLDRKDKPEVDGVVRMPRLNGEYIFTQSLNEKVLVTYEVDADPGGLLPGWIARMASRDIPLHTLVNLRKRVAKMSKLGTYKDYIAHIKKITQ
ncbi:MAG: START domain-containing protein [Myxococcota bacterium]|nr:START domain-containing protein [Myxococcota bacterium]